MKQIAVAFHGLQIIRGNCLEAREFDGVHGRTFCTYEAEAKKVREM